MDAQLLYQDVTDKASISSDDDDYDNYSYQTWSWPAFTITDSSTVPTTAKRTFHSSSRSATNPTTMSVGHRTTTSERSSPDDFKSKYEALVGGLAAFVVFVVIAVTLFAVYRYLMRRRGRHPDIERFIFILKESQYKPGKERPTKWELDRTKLQIYEDELLGQGAFGFVFKGRIKGFVKTIHKDTTTTSNPNYNMDPMVAVKKCHEYATENMKINFLTEMDVMKKLHHHKHLVNLIQCSMDQQPYLLVMELCSYGDLLNYLRTRRNYMMEYQRTSRNKPFEDGEDMMVISLCDIVKWLVQIADGMEYIGQMMFVHRDLAARNILVDSKRTMKIGDFGLCRSIDDSSDAYLSRGGRLPLKWMSIESLQKWEFNSKTDVWSYGVLIFEIITLGGTPYPDIVPVDGDIRKGLLKILLKGERMAKPDDCPQKIYNRMLGCWRADPKNRPTFTDLKEQFSQMLEGMSADASNYYGLYVDISQPYYGTDERLNVGVVSISNKKRDLYILAEKPLPASEDSCSIILNLDTLQSSELDVSALTDFKN